MVNQGDNIGSIEVANRSPTVTTILMSRLRQFMPLATMKLFHVTTERNDSSHRSIRIWLAIADDPQEAKRLIPPKFIVTAVKCQPAGVGGPSRLIGWMGPSLLGRSSGQSPKST